MTEPIYSYVKGQGWVASTCDFRIIKSSDNKTYRIELRPPTPGELYRYTYSPWDLDQWSEWCTKSNKYEVFLNHLDYGHYLSKVDRNPTTSSYITLVEL